MFKKSIKTEVENHGPHSLLPLGDIKIEGDRKIKWQSNTLQKNELLYIYQLGFGANHSTDTCLSQLTVMILKGDENLKHMSIILIDFKRRLHQR